MRIGIVTDSTADIPAHLVEQYQITLVPNLLMIDNQTYLDGRGISREDFYQQLPTYRQPPTTAAPSISIYQQVYEDLLSQGVTHIFSIHPSSALSALYNIASLAAKSFQDRISVVDSRQVSLGLGFQVIGAAQAAMCGAAVDQIAECLEGMRSRIHVFALLDSLEYVRRSGRVNWATATLGSVLQLRVMIAVRNGLVQRIGFCRGRKEAVVRLLHLLHKVGPLEKLAALHTSILDPGEIQQIVAHAPAAAEPPIVVPVTTIIGTHVGPFGLGVAALTSQPN